MNSAQTRSSVNRAGSIQRIPSGLLSAMLLLSATPALSEVIWRGDFETGTTAQWRGAPKSDSIKVVEDPVREGKYALRIDGTNAAQKGKLDRIELQHQPEPPGTAEGTERYFGWSVFVPKRLTDDMHAVGYFETRNSWRQLMSFEVRGEDILYSTRVPYARRWSGKGKLTPGRWHDFAVHVLWSRDPAKGFVEVWFDGEQVVPRTMTATLLDENVAFFQIGLMRDTIDVPETILIDHVIEATTLEEVTPAVSLGRVAQFELKDVQGKTHTQKSWAAAPAVVYLFLGTECPVANGYAPEMSRLAKQFAERGVVFVGVHCDPDVTAMLAAQHAREHQLTFPILLDPEQTLAKPAGVHTMSASVVVLPDGEVVYRGRIDDRYTDQGKRRFEPTTHDLKEAIEAVLAGRKPKPAETKAYGCPLPSQKGRKGTTN